MERIPASRKLEHMELDPAIREGLKQLFSFESEEFFIDKGGVGSVYSLPQGFCIKVMDPRHNSSHKHLFNLGNSALQEGHFQEIMANTEFKGQTRTPRLFGVFTGVQSNEKSALVMEKLEAINLEHILLRRQRLPVDFDIDEFFDDLERYVQHMHETEEILHGDLFARNVMVDTATTMPRVIDWGRSQHLDMIGTDRKLKKEIDDEWNRLDFMYESVKALQT